MSEMLLDGRLMEMDNIDFPKKDLFMQDNLKMICLMAMVKKQEAMQRMMGNFKMDLCMDKDRLHGIMAFAIKVLFAKI